MNHYAEILFARIQAELKTESARAYLGFLWWLIEPMMYMAVFYIVFGVGLRQGGEGYVFFLLAGLIPWKWLDSSVRSSAMTISGSIGLVNQVYFPKIILPLSVVGTNTFKFLIIFLLYLVFIHFMGFEVNQSWWQLPAILFIEMLLIITMSVMAAAITPLVPDVRYIINYGMTFLFFMSGIFFALDSITPDLRQYLVYNPVAVIIDWYRMVLLNHEFVPLHDLGIMTAALLMAMLFSISFVRMFDRYYPRVLG